MTKADISDSKKCSVKHRSICLTNTCTAKMQKQTGRGGDASYTLPLGTHVGVHESLGEPS